MDHRISLRKRLALKLYARLERHRSAEHRLTNLFWECTLRCNLNCRHCGSDCTIAPDKKDMPASDFLRVIDSLTPHINPNKTLIIFSGGEVLVRRDIEACGAELYRRGYPWGMVTNGMLLDSKRMDSLMASGMRSLCVSLDGLEEYHNWFRGSDLSFRNATRAIRLAAAAEEPLEWDVVTCVTGRNLAQLPELKELLITLGVKRWRIFTIFPAGRAKDDRELDLTDVEFKQVMDFIRATRHEKRIDLSYACEGFLGGYEMEVRDKFYTCSAGVSVASIRIDGSISGCTSIRSDFAQGNIYKDDFWDVWSNRFQKFRNRDWARTGRCEDCKVFEFCGGGGMHLRQADNPEVLMCHYERVRG